MLQANLLSLFWEGFVVQGWEAPDEQSLIVTLAACGVGVCSGCGERVGAVHDTTWRRVRERDLLGRRVGLRVPVRRVKCPSCGVHVERVAWLAGQRALTRGLIAWIEILVHLLPIKQVAALVGVHWHTVKAIDKARLRRDVPVPDYSQVRRLIMDEFALFKGHRYATVVICAATQAVLWIGEGRSRQAIRPFFKALGSACAQIEAVAMDMNSAFDLEVRAHCPRAEIVYDLFHVIAKYGRDVIDRVRVDQANALRDQRPARRVIKRSRWLLRNPENLTDEQAVRLDELLAANAPLATVHVLKAQLKELWFAASAEIAQLGSTPLARTHPSNALLTATAIPTTSS